jgi:hypothetical protein
VAGIGWWAELIIGEMRRAVDVSWATVGQGSGDLATGSVHKLDSYEDITCLAYEIDSLRSYVEVALILRTFHLESFVDKSGMLPCL